MQFVAFENNMLIEWDFLGGNLKAIFVIRFQVFFGFVIKCGVLIIGLGILMVT